MLSGVVVLHYQVPQLHTTQPELLHVFMSITTKSKKQLLRGLWSVWSLDKHRLKYLTQCYFLLLPFTKHSKYLNFCFGQFLKVPYFVYKLKLAGLAQFHSLKYSDYFERTIILGMQLLVWSKWNDWVKCNKPYLAIIKCSLYLLCKHVCW